MIPVVKLIAKRLICD